MAIIVNCRHLEAHSVRLQGELPVKDLDIGPLDETVQVQKPLEYDFEAEQFDGGLLLTGALHLDLTCECVRCLKTFTHRLSLENWTRHLPLEGEEKVAVVNDCVDLTPYVREDMLLEFPQHPLCNPDCEGLPKNYVGRPKNTSSNQPEIGSPAWNELNKLKF